MVYNYVADNIRFYKGQTFAEPLRRTKDYRRKVPRNGWAYFASRYHNPEGRKVFKIPSPVEILFNYERLYQQLEHDGALFRLSD